MADLTKFRQTERMYVDLTILANFSEIRQSEISSTDLPDDFNKFSLLRAWFLDIRKWNRSIEEEAQRGDGKESPTTNFSRSLRDYQTSPLKNISCSTSWNHHENCEKLRFTCNHSPGKWYLKHQAPPWEEFRTQLSLARPGPWNASYCEVAVMYESGMEWSPSPRGESQLPDNKRRTLMKSIKHSGT